MYVIRWIDTGYLFKDIGDWTLDKFRAKLFHQPENAQKIIDDLFSPDPWVAIEFLHPLNTVDKSIGTDYLGFPIYKKE